MSTREPMATVHSALREVLQRVPDVRPVTLGTALPLERMPGDADAPHVAEAEAVEERIVRAHPVPGDPTPGFAAFLDGTQESQVLAWMGAAPIVYGRVAAVIRERVQRRLVTWRAPIVDRRLYAPLAYTGRQALESAFPPASLVDTAAPDANGEIPKPHPILLLERARSAVARAREDVERRLAEQWCRVEQRPVLIDGGIGVSETVAHSPCVVGVVKSHRALYVDGDALDTVLALRVGERSTVIRIAPRGSHMSSVLSWYLRLRSPDGHDALWGLVRVEAADADRAAPSTDATRITERADTVSRWILAERAPISLPDPRWDKMVYGVRNAEEYLKT